MYGASVPEFDGCYIKLKDNTFVELLPTKAGFTYKEGTSFTNFRNPKNKVAYIYDEDRIGMHEIDINHFSGIAWRDINIRKFKDAITFHELGKVTAGQVLMPNGHNVLYVPIRKIQLRKKSLGSDTYYFKPRDTLHVGEYLVYKSKRFYLFRIISENRKKLFKAIDRNSIVLAEKLLNQGTDANAIGDINAEPAICAATSTEMIELLLKHKANPNEFCIDRSTKKSTAMIYSYVRDNEYGIVKALLEEGAVLFMTQSYAPGIDKREQFDEKRLYDAAKSKKMRELLKKYMSEKALKNILLKNTKSQFVKSSHSKKQYICVAYKGYQLCLDNKISFEKIKSTNIELEKVVNIIVSKVVSTMMETKKSLLEMAGEDTDKDIKYKFSSSILIVSVTQDKVVLSTAYEREFSGYAHGVEEYTFSTKTGKQIGGEPIFSDNLTPIVDSIEKHNQTVLTKYKIDANTGVEIVTNSIETKTNDEVRVEKNKKSKMGSLMSEMQNIIDGKSRGIVSAIPTAFRKER